MEHWNYVQSTPIHNLINLLLIFFAISLLFYRIEIKGDDVLLVFYYTEDVINLATKAIPCLTERRIGKGFANAFLFICSQDKISLSQCSLNI